MYKNKIPKTIVKSQSLYYGSSTTSPIQNGVLGNTLHRFTAFFTNDLAIGHLLIL